MAGRSVCRSLYIRFALHVCGGTWQVKSWALTRWIIINASLRDVGSGPHGKRFFTHESTHQMQRRTTHIHESSRVGRSRIFTNDGWKTFAGITPHLLHTSVIVIVNMWRYQRCPIQMSRLRCTRTGTGRSPPQTPGTTRARFKNLIRQITCLVASWGSVGKKYKFNILKNSFC
jgi:hypothetical protein